MITNPTIGKDGRLGNQLFQYAFLFGHCLRNHRRAFVNGDHPRFDLQHFELMSGDLVGVVSQRRFQSLYDQEIVASCPERAFAWSSEMAEGPDRCAYTGFFQSPLYFADCADELRSVLRFSQPLQGDAARWEAKIEGSSVPVVGIHVRLGDYRLQERHHTNLQKTNYYTLALRILTSALSDRFIALVFSDDIAWCESSGLFAEYPNVRFVSGLDHVSDLRLMSLCDHHVIANSSFSWWGAWLAESDRQIVIAPKAWFGPAKDQQFDTIFLPNWKVIDSQKQR